MTLLQRGTFMRSFLAAIAILLNISVINSGARADVFYYYTGPSFIDFSKDGNGNQIGPYTSANKVTGWFSTAAALPANLAGSGYTTQINSFVTNFSFTDGLNTISYSDFASFGCAAPNYSCFNVATDDNGNIETWVLNMTPVAFETLALGQTAQNIFIENQATLDFGGTATCIKTSGSQCTDWSFIYGSRNDGVQGTWTMGAVPEPATWLLLIIGFIGLGAVRLGSRSPASRDVG